ncbi:helix-turn-helix transcriptional regulator [Rhizobium sp. SSA_523]|uniref:transcriptional regulator VisR n=1 Tax=Rhizobium sp. SSA_523 TaxID=2952477 RepID=UPI002091073D|nr:helix-turn-helix transcriptional regulator [Rhizobium sp. SSA_523]MCO5732989.1 helix-turn-helix transcriptional regulator [Rhizobium sp. SSA_523]WKC23873.1 helix-turn-helix transcriptional regulator [Rhizobium sp. SSA_523]
MTSWQGVFEGGGAGPGVYQGSTARASSRSDVFPRLVAMQKALHARNFAVLRISGAGLPNKRKMVCELDNWGGVGAEQGRALLEAYGDAFLHHIEVSVLPMAWSSMEAEAKGTAGEAPPMVVKLETRDLPFSGIAFPVRLGAVGNGFVAFSGGPINIASDLVVEQHVRSCHVMMDLLALDERRAVPSEALSEREIACLQLAGDGQISEEIAERLGLSVHTVNAYLGSATIKLDAVNRIQAIAKAIRLGYIH